MDEASPAQQGAADAPGPVWRFLLTPRWLGWHLLMVVSFWGMLWLGDWQLRRALSGNGLSWAYTFEWPLFAGFAVVFWAKTIRDEFRIKRGQVTAPDHSRAELPVNVGSVQAGTAGTEDDEDPELAAYNAYLARLNAEVKRHGRWHGLRSLGALCKTGSRVQAFLRGDQGGRPPVEAGPARAAGAGGKASNHSGFLHDAKF